MEKGKTLIGLGPLHWAQQGESNPTAVSIASSDFRIAFWVPSLPT